MVTRVSSLDRGYQTGDLSLFPDVIDDKTSLYEVANNAETVLKNGVLYNSKNIIVKDASKFPSKGILRIGNQPTGPGNYELVYYDKRTDSTFSDLVRGFAGSMQSTWAAGAAVTNSVNAETHNAVKDALINIENVVGVAGATPTTGTLANKLNQLETRFVASKAMFRAFPRIGPPPLQVRFQDMSEGVTIRRLWDFGDGTTSIERHPIHTYQQEGVYSVKLNVIGETGSQGVAIKNNYITVTEDEVTPFFYVVQSDATKPAYSVQTAESLVTSGQDPTAVAAEFEFVDQTDGDILQRFWVFDDNENENQIDPNIHATTHTYQTPGEYNPTLLIVFADDRLKRVAGETITVL